jgi:hypothetical protein
MTKIKAPRELIAVTASVGGADSAAGAMAPLPPAADIGSLAALVSAQGGVLRPLFGLTPDRLQAKSPPSAAGFAVPTRHLSRYYRVHAPDERLEALATAVRRHRAVETVYIKPSPEPAVVLNPMQPAAAEPPTATPDFTGNQGYLDPAPGGVDARFAWTVAGGSGQGVAIIDVEGAWRFSHEDLVDNQGGVVAGTPPDDPDWRNHGTAVLGEFCGDRNAFGITGISPGANVRAISIFNDGAAAAIRAAADLLGAGDIILIELHYPGPRFQFGSPQGQSGYIPAEWWPDNLAAIQYATQKGVIVVEAGGNGSENLDDQLYDVNPGPPEGPFPATWSNPFRRNPLDSGAILVGAGAPPEGTHGRDWGPDRSKLDFSNYGSIIDVQAWGREVTTTGYGDLQGGSTEDLWYTDLFSGTSSASPIVVGVLASLQGILRAAGQPLLTPTSARALLRGAGSPQQAGLTSPVSQRIGNRPDLRAYIQQLVAASPSAGSASSSTNGSVQTVNIHVADARIPRVVNINIHP